MRILAAAKSALLDAGYANLATRGIAEAAGVPLSQIHYHFGSKQKLVLAVLDMENQQRLAPSCHVPVQLAAVEAVAAGL